jgi:hypothetical protein
MGLYDPGEGRRELTDGSKVGDWRLPNYRELQSLIDYGRYNPALPEGTPFTAVQSFPYWSSTTQTADCPYIVGFNAGGVVVGSPSQTYSVWCVRGGP